MNLIPVFDAIDRCVPARVRCSTPWLRTVESLAVATTDADGNALEWIELAIYILPILALSLWIVLSLLSV